MLTLPTPGRECKWDFDYRNMGGDWECHCNEGLEQSPIDLPNSSAGDRISTPMAFEYRYVEKDDLDFIYERGALRLRAKNEQNFGELKDADSGQIYEAYEIVFHTPGEHKLMHKNSDMEVQILHRTTQGDFKMQAVLSSLYFREPGNI